MNLSKDILKRIIKRLMKIIIIFILFISIIIGSFLIWYHYDSKRIIEQCVADGESLEICKRYID